MIRSAFAHDARFLLRLAEAGDTPRRSTFDWLCLPPAEDLHAAGAGSRLCAQDPAFRRTGIRARPAQFRGRAANGIFRRLHLLEQAARLASRYDGRWAG